MGDNRFGRRKDDLPKAPDTGGGGPRPAAAALGEPLNQFRGCNCRRPMVHLEQAMTKSAARVRVRLDHLVAALDANLPACRALSLKPHGAGSSPSRTSLAPCSSTRTT